MRLSVYLKRMCGFIVLFFIFLLLLKRFAPNFVNRVEHEDFLQLDVCPICFGHYFCKSLLKSNYAVITGFSRIKSFNYFNVKNVFYGKLKSGTSVVLKKLSWDSEFSALGRQFCEMIDLTKCDVKNAARIYSAEFMKNFSIQSKKSRAVFGFKDTLACPSKRFLKKLFDDFMTQEIPCTGNDRLDSLTEFVSTIHLNPEPLIIQSFKSEDGWPFPHYYGPCGRIIIEENAGEPLANYLSSEWDVRAQLAYQLLRIADKLTYNPTNFAFYMTDVNLHNFAVSSSAQVTLIDVENLVVVDKKDTLGNKFLTWNKTLNNSGIGCADCLSYSADDLCSHHDADHNFYAICRGIIGPNSYYAGKGGLLHNIPTSLRYSQELKSLIDKCSFPLINNSNRIKSGQKLMSLLMLLF